MRGAHQKFQKSVFAKSFRLPRGTFSQKRIFDFPTCNPPFPKNRHFRPSGRAKLSWCPKSRLCGSLAPDPGHPRAPNFHGTPQPPFPAPRASLVAIGALAREKIPKNRFFTFGRTDATEKGAFRTPSAISRNWPRVPSVTFSMSFPWTQGR